MITFSLSKDLSAFVIEAKTKKKSIGFVPTMGALHKGHLSLLEKASQENDLVICSIYVNPTQFNNASDLKNYPRNVNQDANLLKKNGCNVLFTPTTTEMYPEKLETISLNLDNLDKYLEGEHRPGHFEGVITIVNRLFDIVKPTKAYFGQKDYQQYCVIKKMAELLNPGVEIILCPTIRESDGLAMSSRNMLLTSEERKKAPALFKAMQNANNKSLGIEPLIQTIIEEIEQEPLFSIDYVDIADKDNLEPLSEWGERSEAQVFIAAFLGNVRLIDNATIKR